MKKAQGLRAAIVAQLPEFETEPDRLKIWVEDGSASCTLTPDESFQISYRLNVLLVEMRSDIALLALAVFRWLRVNQPDLMVPPATGFSFEADVLDNKTADIVLQLDLDECVAVTPREDGGSDLNYLDEPDPLFDDEQGVGDPDVVPDLAGHFTLEDAE